MRPSTAHPRLSALLAALLVATVWSPVASAPRAPTIEGGDAGGWVARAPAWFDPGQRGATFGSGDAPRALPPRHETHRLERAPEVSADRSEAPNGAERPSLTAMGRRQSDGG